MKKRVLSLLMASAMIVGLTACGSSNEPAATASTDSGNTATTTADNSGSAAAGDVSMTFTWWGNQTGKRISRSAGSRYRIRHDSRWCPTVSDNEASGSFKGCIENRGCRITDGTADRYH